MKQPGIQLRYTLIGFLFGLVFPLAAYSLVRFFSADTRQLLIIISTAPLFLGLLSYIAGRQRVRVDAINESLEGRVEESTRSIRALMDQSGQGFLSFGSDMSVEPVYSRMCRELFGDDITGKAVDQLLFHDEKTAVEFRQGMELFFSGQTRSDVIFELMETETVVNGRYISLTYKEINSESILCIISDVTNARHIEDRNSRDEERRTIILRAISNKYYFSTFIREAEELMEFLRLLEYKAADEESLHILMKLVHTFKGNAGFFGFIETQEVAHDFEYYISDSLILASAEDIELRDISLDLKKAYYRELNIIGETLGKQWLEDADGIIVPRQEYLKIERYITRRYAKDKKLNAAIRHFRKVPFRQLFAQFPDMALRIAENLGKKLDEVTIEGGEFAVLPDTFEHLVSVCVHLIRNMVDHGIEVPVEREVLGKPSGGRLRILLERQPNSLVLAFSDDGRGISARTIEKRAVEGNLIPADHNKSDVELIQLIFTERFSTASEISETSGRGVGLSAVRDEVRKLGGKIRVHSKLNDGTSFELLLPTSLLQN